MDMDPQNITIKCINILRYMRFSRMVDEGVSPPWNIVPERKEGYTRARLLPRCQVASDRVFLCRKVYDPRGRRMYKNPY